MYTNMDVTSRTVPILNWGNIHHQKPKESYTEPS